jgi:hypothetical protein
MIGVDNSAKYGIICSRYSCYHLILYTRGMRCVAISKVNPSFGNGNIISNSFSIGTRRPVSDVRRKADGSN